MSKLTRKSPERHKWRRSGVFVVKLEHFSPFFSVSMVDFEQITVSLGK